MTMSDDLNFVEEGEEFEGSQSAYPSLFGITFTPKIGGIGIGVLGLLGAGYLVLNMVMPAWQAYQERQAKTVEIQGQIDSKNASVKQIGKVKEQLAKAKQQKVQVMALFANESTLDTLLLDLNRLVESGSTSGSGIVKGKLKKYVPANQKAELITDGSLGAGVNGKLKRRMVNVEIEGTYEQTQEIVRNIERLQPLLIVKDYDSKLAPPPQMNGPTGKLIPYTGPPGIATNFQLQALVPASPADIAAAPKEPKK